MELDVGLALTSVQRPQDVADRLGDYSLAAVDTSWFANEDLFPSMQDMADFLGLDYHPRAGDALGVVYEDKLLSMAVVDFGEPFLFRIENLSQDSIRLRVPEIAFVDPSGLSIGVGTSLELQAASFSDYFVWGRAAPPEPQNIPSHGVLAFWLASNRVEGGYAACGDVPGTEIRIVLPIELQGVTDQYTLRFQPQYADMVTMKESKSGNEWGGVSSWEDSRTRCWPTP